MQSWSVHTRRALAGFAAAAIALLTLLAVDASPADAVRPPGIPSASTAQSELGALDVASESHGDSYDRDLFPHWKSVTGSGGCTARQYVLKRDGEDVVTRDGCQPASGRWQSDFDDVWTTSVSGATIDHVVALSEAWASGAWAWSTAERQAFANDIDSPQLWIATTSANSSKSDFDPAEWMPSNTSVRCDYVKAWIHVKYLYDLTVDSAERDALQSHLSDYCGTDGGDPAGCTGSAGPDRTITEGGTVESAISLSCTGDASSSSEVSVTVTHDYYGDIDVDLEAPDGTVYTVQSSGSGRGDFGTRAYTLDLSDEDASGTWRLQVTDTYAGGTTGTLDRWSLSL